MGEKKREKFFFLLKKQKIKEFKLLSNEIFI